MLPMVSTAQQFLQLLHAHKRQTTLLDPLLHCRDDWLYTDQSGFFSSSFLSCFKYLLDSIWQGRFSLTDCFPNQARFLILLAGLLGEEWNLETKCQLFSVGLSQTRLFLGGDLGIPPHWPHQYHSATTCQEILLSPAY